MGDVDINALTMKQYFPLTRGNQAPGVVNPEIGNNVNFEIKGEFMRELREDTFSGNKNDDAHEYIEKVLDIVSFFNISIGSHDTIMLRVFHITLTGAAKRWIDRIPSGTINTWDLLKKAFIQRYYPPSKNAKQLEDIHNFKQDDHSQKWHDDSRRTSSGSADGIAAITSKLESLGRDMKKLKEKVHAIQIGCGLYRGTHLDNECPLNEEVKGIEEVKYGEFGRSFPNDGGNGASVGGRGMKENKQVSANDATKDTIKMVSSPYVDEPVVVDGNTKGPTSYAKLVTSESSRKSVNFCTLTAPVGNGADVAIPLEYIRAISEQFVYSAYGFFLGKRVSYPVVSNYVKNTWSKYGLVKSMLNSSNGLFFFQFSSKDGLDAMLENEDVGSVTVWVKFNGIPMMAFSKDGLSIIATKLGNPLMLDFYTSDMCMQSWGRSSYARAMIDLQDDEELKYSIMVAMLKLISEGFNMCTVCVEYEWKPPRCLSCKVFRHVLNECPKKIVSDVVKILNNPRQATRGVPIGPKNAKILDGKLMFVDDDENPLVRTGNVDSGSGVDETTNLMDLTSFKSGSNRGYGTNSLLEQWRETKWDDDYNPYDDGLYESHVVSSFEVVVLVMFILCLCNELKYGIHPHPFEKKPSLEELINKHIEESRGRSNLTEDWMKKLQENTYVNIRNQNAALKNLETQIEQLTKDFHAKAAKEVSISSTLIGHCTTIFADINAQRVGACSNETNELNGANFISNYDVKGSKKENEGSSRVLPC
ncbi:copia protein [Tanacetum coccineum]